MGPPRSQRNAGAAAGEKDSASSTTTKSKSSSRSKASSNGSNSASTANDQYDAAGNLAAGGGSASTANSAGGASSASSSSASSAAKDLVSIDTLPVETLRKYRRIHNLSATVPSALSSDGYLLNSAVGRKTLAARNSTRVSKHELAGVIKKHFAAQNPRESEVIVDFIYSVNRQGEFFFFSPFPSSFWFHFANGF